jgi:DNA-binding FrmR family transcriptional regulator
MNIRRKNDMNIEKVIEQLPKVKEQVEQLEEMVEDYNNCKSAVTKKLLTSAIEKYSSAVGFKDIAEA